MTGFAKAAALAAAMVGFADLAAAEPNLPQSSDVSTPDRPFVMDLGLGASLGPRYDGADDYLLRPVPLIGFSRVTLPYVGEVGDQNPRRGFFFFPSFDYIGSRDPSDSNDLKGTEEVDWALALGAGAGYRYDWFRGFVQADFGINGYSGGRVRIGADFVGEPADRWSLSFGPRLDYAGDGYMDTYFSVSDRESRASDGRLAPYEADSGLRSVGLASIASYAINDKVFALFNLRYDRLIGDADDSPIVKVGSANQWTFGAGLSYRFAFDLPSGG